MWTGGWTDSRHEPHIHFLEMCELSDIAHFVIQEKYSQVRTYVGWN